MLKRRWLTTLPAQWLSTLPRQCELCRGWGHQALCEACLGRFAQPRPRCLRCGLAGLDDRMCGQCQAEPPPFAHTVAAVDYAFPWDRLIQQLKFHGQVELSGALAACLAEAVLKRALPLPELLLPVPLSAPRLRERGYNQAWELCRGVAAILNIPAHAQALVRADDAVHQVGLTRAERLKNLRHAMWVVPALRSLVMHRQVALIDDVMTSGATAHAAAQALLAAGAAQVQIWVLARTPRGD